ncbi:hypothetical protein BN79_015 [Yersinia phage phiR2-01]|uniref:Uncharacterized protein n=1 Tax=Yersinia phage phiR2-01 TaxID=1206557 RepID=I7J3S7_9CAUD|nr:hypothetical protein BN79_015 [Yersinia phage phiR2-01]CCI88443.1 hypothetical protein BN79_015 [Yersinia phage phiR2-01]
MTIDGTRYLLDDFGKEFVIDGIYDNVAPFSDITSRAQTFDESWREEWKSY